ncbi:hypothetical protein QBC33DRAFT_552930 [Phialemonium atrogriseum]|uniref:ATP-dependent RNA helicase DHX8 n=1 Tax=Phialemonium atrogriseum TaxID=1093897 RepID=A0AAJ0BPD8_9PEZI|nr:uncharacterized protein QBC33DRAFT_552930 [Phialemonium atrogriseum]KAK1762024.1 hypothetical protein QBC33DRAFT_552930 [Phialemonium atrogriseum]
MSTPPPYKQIRASYNADTITVYQAYNRAIATAAVAEQKLHASPAFKPTRMTWIKPSWAWMLYRAGYSYKDPGQERILALKMKHADLIRLLETAVLTTAHGSEPETAGVVEAPQAAAGAKPKSANVKVQWDPERTVRLERLEYRSIQIGIPAALSPTWTEKWIVSIEDVTERARELKRVLDERQDVTEKELVDMGLVPVERPFEIPESLQLSLGMVLK